MAEDKVIIGVGVDSSQAETSVKSLRQQMRDLRDEMGRSEFGSAAFNNAAEKAGELQHKMKLVKETMDNFNPEKKFQAFATVIGGAAHSMEAAVGATALFGSENKNLEAAILKTQGAMALANGLNGLLGMKTELKSAANVITTMVTKAFGSLRAAIISTGIGALVILLGVMIANWKEIVSWMEKTFPVFTKIEAFFKDFKAIAMGTLDSIVAGFKNVGSALGSFFTGHFSEAVEKFKQFGKETAEAYAKGFEAQKNKSAKEADIEERKQRLELMQAQGKEYLAFQLKLQKDELSLLEKGSDEYNKKLIEIEKTKTEIRKKAAAERAKLDAEMEKAKQRQFEEDKKFAEFESSEIDRKLKEKEDEIKWLDAARKRQEEEDKKFGEFQSNLNAQHLKEKEDMYKAIGSGLNSLSQLAGDNAEVGKTISVASAVIDTYAGATKAFAQGGTFGFITAAAVIAAGLVNVQKILSVQVPKSSGGGASAPSMSAPSMPNIANHTSLINGNDAILTRTLDVKNNKIYVLEHDITNKQKLVSNNNSKAKIK